jgi:hypothetical protein
LNLCDECRLELHRLRYAVGCAPEPELDDSVLARLRDAMEAWERSQQQSSRNGSHVKLRVATEIAPFLGPQATNAILKTVTETDDNLLSTLEPVLGLFLGNRAASRLVGHVVDSALIRA